MIQRANCRPTTPGGRQHAVGERHQQIIGRRKVGRIPTDTICRCGPNVLAGGAVSIVRVRVGVAGGRSGGRLDAVGVRVAAFHLLGVEVVDRRVRFEARTLDDLDVRAR